MAASGLISFGWLDLGLPTPFCPLHALTGIPCPTCGMTRGLVCLLQGQIEEALLFNPLMMVALLSALLYLLYAGVVVIGRLPRLRWEPLSQTAAICVRIGVVLLIAVNWIYLMCAKI